jgi:hypothetical protein
MLVKYLLLKNVHIVILRYKKVAAAITWNVNTVLMNFVGSAFKNIHIIIIQNGISLDALILNLWSRDLIFAKDYGF